MNEDEDNGDRFRHIIANGTDREKARWDAVSDKIITEARSLLGVELTRDDVVRLPSARLAVLTDDSLSTRWLDEARALDAVKEAMRQKELRDAIQQGEEAALATLPRNPAQRMARARELGLTGETTSRRTPSSVADEATMIRRLLSMPPSRRLAKAREWGLA